ncbi:ABC transporter substrate-binding protein [Staphylococcus aureus]|uniref:siderophore ABC transporter substrate-binding protein n=1 Tax=Staphylococcus aureus TaxID=1280 RepID=UPI0018ECBCA8|nr:ABC transporter substrate-binding protein [Staphylococcus aureus]MBJ6275875.1 ABC transporter substrate-binding protein [Staphylococcus aureus]MBJ6281179.1 ABC transporter substrate-binding protein [Staphylococcus aureus]MBJ6283859.1 ABC transporter substrate-binding protein [Staphylococcus aureus]MBJ6286579.1 ABC transporter substrate-binding protein [Staphylococcus aureus]MBJ6289250.1 ABC transporter substrate-binding protein [Staphylococcus aureus]
MKKYLISFFIITIILTGCSNSSDKNNNTNNKSYVKVHSSYDIRGEHKDGKDAVHKDEILKITKNPKNVVTFDYGAADTIKVLGKSSSIKGIAKGKGSKSLPKELSEFKDNKYKNVGTLGEPDYDSIAKIKPDLIIFSARTANKKVLDELKKASPDSQLLYIGTDNKKTIESIKKNTSYLGKIFNNESKSKEYITKLDKVVSDTKRETKNLSKNAMLLLISEGELSTYGPKDRFGGLIFGELGIKPADNNIKSGPHGKPVSFEYVSEKNPDIIFSMDRDKAITGIGNSKRILSNDVIKEINAVKNSNIEQLDPREWYFSTNGINSSIKQVNEIKEAIKRIK